jgi:two-component system phosphate regulon response regulator PhoB
VALILVVEDELDVQRVIEYNLRDDGYRVVTATGGRDALRLARQTHPDLVLLDLMLPDIRGTEVCRALKQSASTKTIPVIVVTACGEEVDRVVAFELGADDYVVKPFSVRELLLRIRAVLRRPIEGKALERSFEFGVLRVDRDAHRVWVQDREITLTALEFKILTTLHDRGQRVQTRDTLLEQVWGGDTPASTRTVDAHVKRLREKLGEARHYIETVRGVGYRFAEPQTVECEAGQTAPG